MPTKKPDIEARSEIDMVSSRKPNKMGQSRPNSLCLSLPDPTLNSPGESNKDGSVASIIVILRIEGLSNGVVDLGFVEGGRKKKRESVFARSHVSPFGIHLPSLAFLFPLELLLSPPRSSKLLESIDERLIDVELTFW